MAWALTGGESPGISFILKRRATYVDFFALPVTWDGAFLFAVDLYHGRAYPASRAARIDPGKPQTRLTNTPKLILTTA